MATALTERENYRWLFPEPGDAKPTIEEFEKMVSDAENTPTITYNQFKKEIDEWLENHL